MVSQDLHKLHFYAIIRKTILRIMGVLSFCASSMARISALPNGPKHPGLCERMVIKVADEDILLVAFRYGESLFPTANVFYNDTSGTVMSIAWLFYFMRYKKHKILIDVGNGNIDVFRRYGFLMRNFHKPVCLLKQFGLVPDDITDVFVTHSDFDHIGDINLYKNAKIYIQEDEMEKCAGCIEKGRDIIVFRSYIRVYDKFELVCVGGHTVGSSIVRFEQNGIHYVLGGDECYVNESLEKGIPIGRSYNIGKSRAFIEEYRKPCCKVYFFHEPAVVKGDLPYQLLLE